MYGLSRGSVGFVCGAFLFHFTSLYPVGCRTLTSVLEYAHGTEGVSNH